MPLSEDVLRRYVFETAGAELTASSIARASKGCDAATTALHALAGDSLFDTEPEQLHSVLESLAEDDTAMKSSS